MQAIETLASKGLMNIVEEGSGEYQFVKKGFLKGMGFMGHATTVMALHKNNVSSSLAKQARLDSFHVFSKAVAIKCGGGDAHVKHAWYGGSLDELIEIASVGFGGCNIREDQDHDESHGVGISLFSAHFSIDR